MLGREKRSELEKLYQSGLSDTYTIFCKVSKSKISKLNYRKTYNQTFTRLEQNECLPKVTEYPITRWIKKNKDRFLFVYATGGQKKETEFILKSLGLDKIFDLKNSLSKSNYRYAKSTGLPFKQFKMKFGQCFLITDSQGDCSGARRANIPYLQIKPGQKFKNPYFA